MSFALFFAIWFAAIALAHWYVGRRVINAAHFSRSQKRMAWMVVGILFMLPQAQFVLFINRTQSTFADVLSWAGYVEMGFFSFVLSFMLIRDVVLQVQRGLNRLILAGVPSKRAERGTPRDEDRRRFLLHSTNIGVVGLAAVVSGYGFYEARRRATIEEVSVPLKRLPSEFDGLRIVQFTDLHVGPTIRRSFVEGVVEQVADRKADLLVFTGDLVDGSVAWLRDDVAPLRELVAPLGKFFITGNHEYYSGVEPWLKEAERLGFDVLLNEHRIISREGGRIVLAGVTDYSGGDFIASHRSDPSAAFANAATDVPRILLAHQPRSIFAASAVDVDLQISGHTHGGQFFPWNHLATMSQPYIKGLHRHGHTWIYVSRGTGYWGPPMRVGITPEITVITLKSL